MDLFFILVSRQRVTVSGIIFETRRMHILMHLFFSAALFFSVKVKIVNLKKKKEKKNSFTRCQFHVKTLQQRKADGYSRSVLDTWSYFSVIRRGGASQDVLLAPLTDLMSGTTVAETQVFS